MMARRIRKRFLQLWEYKNGRKLFKIKRNGGCCDGDKNSNRVINASEEEEEEKMFSFQIFNQNCCT